ncbi:hypothetical protein DIRU0_C06282 [Diutina rugosa]
MNSSAKISLPPISDILQQATQPSSPSSLRIPPQPSSLASSSLAAAAAATTPSPGPSVLPPLHRAMSTPTSSMGGPLPSSSSFGVAGTPLATPGATPATGSMGAFGLSNYRYDYYKPVNNITPPPLSSAGAAAGSGHPHHHPHHYHPHISAASAAPSASAPQLIPPVAAPAPPSQYLPRKADDSKLKRKTRNNLPKETTYILLKWLNDHLNHPYPNSFEKNQLMMSTGLNQQQLSNWFINARRRKIKSMKEQKRLNVI